MHRAPINCANRREIKSMMIAVSIGSGEALLPVKNTIIVSVVVMVVGVIIIFPTEERCLECIEMSWDAEATDAYSRGHRLLGKLLLIIAILLIEATQGVLEAVIETIVVGL